jgi:hypothetical protein
MIYLVEYKPKNRDDPRGHSEWSDLDSVIILIQNWLALLDAYNKIHTVYDDPILRSNQERFEKQFDIHEPDADYAPFNLAQQLYLDEYLNSVKSKILTLKEGRSESEKNDLAELEQEASEIQKDLTREPKRVIVKRLSRLWAKAQKVGLDVIKEILVSYTVELTKRILTSGQ